MKLLLTFLMATGLSLPVFAQTATNESMDSDGTQQNMQTPGYDSTQHDSSHQGTLPQSEEETDLIEKDTDVTRPDGSKIQEEEIGTEETMKTDTINSPSSSDSETTIP